MWRSVASSADGSKLVAVFSQPNGGRIYTSTNSGVTWSQATNAPGANWSAIASSADGNKLIAVVFGGSIYTSTNSGNIWTTNNLPANSSWYAAASSADGTKLIVAAQKGLIYTSTNSGANWVSNSVPGLSWQSVASSADGNKLVAAVHNGGIYTWQSAPTPQLNLTVSNNNFALSWLVPSTNFVLQQNSDLTTTNWTDVTNPPVLNLTNLQDEVTLPMAAGSGFYRLKTP